MRCCVPVSLEADEKHPELDLKLCVVGVSEEDDGTDAVKDRRVQTDLEVAGAQKQQR